MTQRAFSSAKAPFICSQTKGFSCLSIAFTVKCVLPFPHCFPTCAGPEKSPHCTIIQIGCSSCHSKARKGFPEFISNSQQFQQKMLQDFSMPNERKCQFNVFWATRVKLPWAIIFFIWKTAEWSRSNIVQKYEGAHVRMLDDFSTGTERVLLTPRWSQHL